MLRDADVLDLQLHLAGLGGLGLGDVDLLLDGGLLERQLLFRVGHLGLVDENDIEKVIVALKTALPKAGFGGTQS